MLLLASTDTTSRVLTRTLHLLSLNPMIQTALHMELADRDTPSEPDLDKLDQFPILDAVCRETLRVYPPATFLSRTARTDTVLPLSHPITLEDGTEASEVFFPNGTHIFVSLGGPNRSEAIWGNDAKEWRPERWFDGGEPWTERVPGIYSNLMSFIGGGRACIGFKFALLEMKAVLFVLVRAFHFVPAPGLEVEWHLGGIYCPAVVGDKQDAAPRLPIGVVPRKVQE